MGEIKSTLDLVMEKTRHLTLSDEEKADQKEKDARSRLKGVIQKTIDQSLTVDEFKKELVVWRQSFQMPDSVVIQEAVRLIDLDKRDQPVLTLLQTVLKDDLAELIDIIKDYQLTIDKALEEKAHQIEMQLKNRHAISGTAVVAYVEHDDDWKVTRQQYQSEYRRQLKDRVSRMG